MNKGMNFTPQVCIRVFGWFWLSWPGVLPAHCSVTGQALLCKVAPSPTLRPTGHLLSVAQLRPAALLLLLQGLLLCVELRAEGLIGHGVGALGMVVGVGGHLLLAVGCGHREELSSGCPWDVLALTAVLESGWHLMSTYCVPGAMLRPLGELTHWLGITLRQ